MMNEPLKNALGFCAGLLSYMVLGLVTLKMATAERVIVIHPEAMAGDWVAAVSTESMSGQLTLELDLRTILTESSERLEGISVAIGSGPCPPGEPTAPGSASKVLDGGFFSCGDNHADNNGNCDFDGTRLLVRAFRGPDVLNDMGLNIAFDPGRGVWRGNFTQDKMTFEVEFQRPHRGRGILADPLEGDWRNVTYPTESPNCLHIRQQSDGELLMWNDLNGHYGVPLSPVHLSPMIVTEPNVVRFQTVSSYGHGYHSFEGVLNTDQTRFEGYWDHNDQVEHPKWSPAVKSVFVRTEGQTCTQH